MRIALNATAIRPGVSGGLEAYALNLCAALGRRPDVAIVVFGVGEFCSRVRELASDDIQCVRVRDAESGRFARILWEQARLVEEVSATGAALLHSLTHVSPLLPRAIPNVVTIPDLIAFRYPEHVGRAKRVYWGIGLPLAIDRASAVIAISEFTRSEVCDLFPGACGKVHVTPLAVDGRLRRAAVEATPASVDQPVDRHLLCVGGLGWHKNTDTLLRGLALHRDLWGSAATPRLVIVGRDYGAKADLRSNVEDLDLDSLVAFAGTVDFGELDSLYRTSLALVAVSHYEGFGFPVLEAMSYGIPVITTRGGAMAEVAGDAAWSVDGSDPRAIAAAIEFARSRGSAMQRKAELGRARASMYTWDRTADETVRVYESLLGDT